MEPIRIALVTAGDLRHPINFEILEKWKSQIFRITRASVIQHLPDSQGPNWQYTDAQLEKLIVPHGGADITAAIINAPLEDNYYMRRLQKNVGVLSLFQTAEILKAANLTIEHFILRNIYEVCTVWLEQNHSIPNSIYAIAHDSVSGCLFDMNAYKTDIVYSMNPPKLCPQCRARVQSRQVPADFLKHIDHELRKIRKARFYRIADWIKSHPITSLIIAIAGSLLSNIAANLLYDLVK